jgi:tripartite-type tricarboxylate transporter receptor subunit TctC
MKRACRAVVALAVLLITGQLLIAGQAVAQANYPDKPIRILAGFPAGGPSDIVARLVGDRLSEALGKPVVVEVMTGAGGTIATDRVVKSAPDGYTLLMATSGMIVVNPSLYPRLPFDPLKDLVPVVEISVQPNFLVVNNGVPANNVQELVALARAQPGKLTFASGGAGTSNHLAGELFKSMAKIDIQHVPYRGVSVALPDLLAGRIDMAFLVAPAALPQVREKRVRAFAVSALKRSPAMPDLPTMAESGFPGFDATTWYALMAPGGTPTAIVERLRREVAQSLAQPEFRKKFDEIGTEVTTRTFADFVAALPAETQQWARVIKEAGIKTNE